MKELRFVCSGPPSHENPGFIEVEDENGESVALKDVGEWRERPDGLWELIIIMSTIC